MKWIRFPRSEKPHIYLSTACLHKVHDRCRENCKYCYAECQCSCHKEKK